MRVRRCSWNTEQRACSSKTAAIDSAAHRRTGNLPRQRPRRCHRASSAASQVAGQVGVLLAGRRQQVERGRLGQQSVVGQPQRPAQGERFRHMAAVLHAREDAALSRPRTTRPSTSARSRRFALGFVERRLEDVRKVRRGLNWAHPILATAVCASLRETSCALAQDLAANPSTEAPISAAARRLENRQRS